MFGVFFFKQKTAYEMRISDWSSDVCSSDLRSAAGGDDGPAEAIVPDDTFVDASDRIAGVEELVAEDLEDDLGWNPGFADRSASNEGGQQHRGRDTEPGPPPAPPAGTCARERGLANWPTSNSDSARATVSNPKIQRLVARMECASMT